MLTPIEQFVVDFVRTIRIERKQTQEQIGFIIGVGKQFISEVENPNHRAKYNMNHVNLLADHFGISPKDFFPASAMTEGIKKEKP